MKLRPYQEAAIESLRKSWKSGHRRIVLVIPTGGGKTAIGCHLVASHLAKAPTNRVLWIAHRTELINQAAATMQRSGIASSDISTIGETTSGTYNPHRRVQCAMIQTIHARGTSPDATMVIYDECHHAPADTYAEVLGRYNTPVLGLTATPVRADGKGLAPMFTDLVVGSDIKQLTSLGHLVPLTVIAPSDYIAKRKDGTMPLAQHPVDAIREHCIGRKTVLFADRVDRGAEYAASLRALGLRAHIVHGGMSAGDRSSVLASELDVLVNVAVLTEGYDDPRLSACVLARGCGSIGTYLQMVGRVLRPSDGKRDAVLVDLRGVTHVHGAPDESYQFSLDEGISRTKVKERFCQICGNPLKIGETCCINNDGEGSIDELDITQAKLEKYAGKRAETDEKRYATIARWQAEQQARGYKRGWLFAKYKSVYGRDLTPEDLRNAAAI